MIEFSLGSDLGVLKVCMFPLAGEYHMFSQLNMNYNTVTHCYSIYVTCSAKTKFMVYFETLRNNSFKYLVCWNPPMVEATSTEFLLVSYLQKRSLYKNQAVKFPTI